MARHDGGVRGGEDGEGRADSGGDPTIGPVGSRDLRDDDQPDEPDESAGEPPDVDVPEAGEKEAQDAGAGGRRKPRDEALQEADMTTASPCRAQSIGPEKLAWARSSAASRSCSG